MHAFNGKYNLDVYLDWELSFEQKFACHDIPENQIFPGWRPNECKFKTGYFFYLAKHYGER